MSDTKKLTQRNYFEEIIALAEANDRADLAEFAKGRIEQLDKKNSNKKPTKTQEANVELKEVILDVLANLGQPSTVTGLMKADDVLGEQSNQKITALLRQLVESGDVVKTIEKKVSYFAIA